MRRLLALSLVVAAATGCRMCASPYDYCGPVVDDCCCGSDYQPQVPYHGAPPQSVEQGVMQGEVIEQPGPIYYEGAHLQSSKTANPSPNYKQTVPAAQLPRQAKKPGRGLF